MKTSTILLSLLFLNSSVLIAQLMSWVFTYVNPFAMIGGELLLVIGYYAHTILKDVRNCFDVDITL